jgi:cobalt-zinc-cadmium efflux system membrane fusion protein
MKSKSNTSSLAGHKKQIFWIVVILSVALVLGGLLLRSSPAVPDAGDAHGEHGDASGHEDEGHSDEDTEAEGDHGHDEGGADSDHEVGAAEKDDHEDEPEGAEHTEAAEVELSETQIVAAGISLATAQPSKIKSAIELPGEITFNQDRTAQVVPRLAGVVEAVKVDLGEQVKHGQVLAVIASTDLSERRSEFYAAQKRLGLAQKTYRREKELWEERISAEQDYLQAQQALREAELTVANAKAQLQALGSDAGKQDALSRYELKAPFDGMIVEKDITLGESVNTDDKIFTISDLSTVWADISVPANALSAVRVGSNAVIESTAFESSANGTVSYVGSLVGQQSRAATARVTLPNPEGVWRPGLFVKVRVGAGEASVPVAVSPDAIHTLEEKPVVFVRTDHGFAAQPIVTGRSDSEAVEIKEGLQAGARYALDNSFIIKSELGKASASHAH